MPLQQADIRFARSVNMADVPEGGGPPTSQLIPDGASNTLFPDISEDTRATGRVEIRQFHTVLRNTDTAALLGANIIIAKPANDPNVDFTLMSTRNPFATRKEIVEQIESSMSPSVEFAGYLLGPHGATQRGLQIFQRPGAEPPGIGLVYMLILNEGQLGEVRQRVRIRSADPKQRMVTATVNGQTVDFLAQITTVELSEPLRYSFPGSEVNRYFAREPNKTILRETVYNDSGMFYGAARLAQPAQKSDTVIYLDTIHSRLVPNSRSEAISADQRPASERTAMLAESPRRVEVGVTPHTQRIKINVANVGRSYVFQLRPLPAPGTVTITYWSMGQRYTVTDDGAGQLTGSGSGLMSYATGIVPVTLQGLPDIGTIVSISYGETVGYTDRKGQGLQVRRPEMAWVLDGAAPDGTGDESVIPGSFSLPYMSGGTLHTITDDGAGKLTGDGTGLIDYLSRTVLVRPAYMPDPDAEFTADYQLETLVTEILTLPSPDAGGFVAITLAQQPAPGTFSLQWAVARAVSNTSGGNLTTTNASKNSTVTYTTRAVPEYYEPAATAGKGVTYPTNNWPQQAN
ncbi:hypothetical protein FVQ98_14035 [Ottowia sp. GY511]|uniref:Uncharacterized protein n=1 Tax=Ottowia flava TaxID=2675430 RepID=A0ABW4KRH9_9BURK|nr:hypothetical protein [Ottowia sp. GY511]TXK26492.1 hypothetical protein FVQ98_14035 [Ottowia sp. GY511]